MYIYRGEDIKIVDQRAETYGMDTFTLMENAGRSLFIALQSKLTKKQRILLLAGRGNNGGDAIVLARYLKNNGYRVELVFPFGESSTETAGKHLHFFRNCGYETSEMCGHYDVIVDGIFGVGTRLPLPENMLELIRWINEQDAFRVAIDMPTGVLANSGELDTAIKADITYCLHGFKPSAFQEGSIDYYGEKQALDIGLSHDSKWKVLMKEDVQATFLQRKASSNKGTYGTGLLMAGNDEMPGSALLASVGAMRMGIGKLMVGTTTHASSIIAHAVPECTYWSDGLMKVAAGDIPSNVKAIAIGPGLVENNVLETALNVLFASDLPLILDAGALHERAYPTRKAPTIVTPHPGEFSRMTGLTVREVQKNRLQLASEYAAKNDLIVVLKGRNTIIAFPDGETFVNRTGNTGLSKGGTGDTLTGMLLASVTSYQNIRAAVCNAVYLHGACADYWNQSRAQASMLASDISSCLPHVLNEFEK
ncbi:NAD(P)H-hydrate dehydratase [Bacillus massiliigorillae]|uniref:NAD(P)H-hydrate dehydratase n=1 Tax=Bacillus massiliigorillae TaxID=1243664 RepID=UPI0003A3C2ED|nr:NAD(P)H-hydrate dehydratase [Bacillus massiliigorillae]